MASNGTNGANKASNFDTSSTIPLWLNGKEIKTSETFDVVSPIDQQKLYSCASASEDDTINAINTAAETFKTWSKTKPSVRRDIFLKAADEFAKRRDELHTYSKTETGAADSMFEFEYALACDACKSVAGMISIASHGSAPTVADDTMSAMLIKEPYGVVLGIAPWNAPYVLGLRACPPASCHGQHCHSQRP